MVDVAADSDSKESLEGAGEGKAVKSSLRDVSLVLTGNDEVISVGDAAVVLVVGVSAVCDGTMDEEEMSAGRPCAARALITASQPLSSVRTRSLSSSFSVSLSRARSSRRRSSSNLLRLADKEEKAEGAAGGIPAPAPARSERFSSSSSATRRSR